MITTVLRELPAFIKLNGCTFQCAIMADGDGSGTLAYVITDGAGPDGTWCNPFFGNGVKYLIKKSGIKTEQQLRLSIYEIKKFLETQRLLLDGIRSSIPASLPRGAPKARTAQGSADRTAAE